MTPAEASARCDREPIPGLTMTQEECANSSREPRSITDPEFRQWEQGELRNGNHFVTHLSTQTQANFHGRGQHRR